MTTFDEWRADRLAAADWHKLPEGYFALPYHDIDDEDVPLLGHRLYRRCVVKMSRNGRAYGQDSFRSGVTYAVAGMEDILRAHLDDDLRYLFGGDRQASLRDQVADLLDDPRGYQQCYGRLRGRCGCCHRTLTDPESKLRGVGPECWKWFR